MLKGTSLGNYPEGREEFKYLHAYAGERKDFYDNNENVDIDVENILNHNKFNNPKELDPYSDENVDQLAFGPDIQLQIGVFLIWIFAGKCI